MRNTVSRQLNQHQIPFYKHLLAGKRPDKVNESEEISGISNRIVNDVAEREIDSEINSETNLVPQSSNSEPSDLPSTANSQVVELNIDNLNTINPAGFLIFPEEPPSRSPLPAEWLWTNSRNSGDLFKTYSIPDGILPVLSPQREQIKVIIENPSARKCISAPTSPTSRRHSGTGSCFLSRRLRSPFLGITALKTSSRQSSEASLDWDGYSNPPSFYQRPSPIPIVNTPSTSFSSQSSLPATPNSPEKMTVPDSLGNDILALQISFKVVENLISMFPPEHMTADRLPIYNDELKEIKDKFLVFST